MALDAFEATALNGLVDSGGLRTGPRAIHGLWVIVGPRHNPCLQSLPRKLEAKTRIRSS